MQRTCTIVCPAVCSHLWWTAEEMQRFVAAFPEYSQRNLIVSKHVAILSELSRFVDQRRMALRLVPANR